MLLFLFAPQQREKFANTIQSFFLNLWYRLISPWPNALFLFSFFCSVIFDHFFLIYSLVCDYSAFLDIFSCISSVLCVHYFVTLFFLFLVWHRSLSVLMYAVAWGISPLLHMLCCFFICPPVFYISLNDPISFVFLFYFVLSYEHLFCVPFFRVLSIPIRSKTFSFFICLLLSSMVFYFQFFCDLCFFFFCIFSGVWFIE